MLKRAGMVMVAVGAAAMLWACPDQGGVPGTREINVSGLTGEEAADVVAEAVCEWTAECGVFWIECRSNLNGDKECDGGLIRLTFQECMSEVGPEMRSDFECVEMTPENAEIISVCITAMVNVGCYSQEDIDAIVAAEEADEEPPLLEEFPPECAQMADVFDGCQVSTEPVPPEPGR